LNCSNRNGKKKEDRERNEKIRKVKRRPSNHLKSNVNVFNAIDFDD
jgi:hypothetical protein